MKESRPKAKFTGSNKVDFLQQKRLLENAIDIPSVTGRQKMQELPHYFDGAAFAMIEYCLHSEDADAAFAEAMGALEKKFGKRMETAMQMLEEALAGKALGENDADGLLALFSKLRSKYYAAKATDKASDFDTATVIGSVIRRKTPFLKLKWAKKAVKYRKEKGGELAFMDLLDFLDDEHSYLVEVEKSLNFLSNASGTGKNVPHAKVAATGADSLPVKKGAQKVDATAGAATTSGETGPLKCAACSGAHALEACSAFAAMDAAAKKKALMSVGACFRCGDAGHLARYCKADAKCTDCSRSHLKILHDIQAPLKDDEGGSTRKKEATSATA